MSKNNNLLKLNLNSGQIIKFGFHLGNSSKKLDYSNIPFLAGIKYDMSYINLSESILQIKKLAFLHKKLLLKQELILIHNNRDNKIIRSLNNSINNSNLFNIKVLKNFKSGLASNKEIRNKFTYLKKFNYDNIFCLNQVNSIFFKKSKFYNSNTNINRNEKSVNFNKFPSLMFLLGYDKDILLEFKKENILTSCLLDTNNFHYVSNYNLLINNKSITSLVYFSKLFRV